MPVRKIPRYGAQKNIGAAGVNLVIVKKDCGVWLHNDTVLRLQVDDNPEPIKELKRLVEMWNVRRPRPTLRRQSRR